jgi:hypothetical protein
MKSFLRLLLLLQLILFAFSCKTDFDVIASYKEVTIVYGLLDQAEPTHYLRITKAFLGEGNALVYAKEPDSSLYGPELQVTLLERKQLSDLNYKTIVFDTVTIHNKDTGIFFSPDQLMYKSDTLLNPAYYYQLNLRNSKTGNQVTSNTNLIQDFYLDTPKPGTKKIGFNRAILTQQNFKWKSAVNGKKYQPVLKFFYKESSAPNDTIIRNFEWILGSSTSDGIGGGDAMYATYLNEDFYKLCESQIPYSDLAKEEAVRVRIADHFEFDITVVGDEFNTYLELNGPTTGLLLEKPSYSNINNGIGVFSSHYVKHFSALVNDITKAALQNTTNLHFFAD